MANRPLVTVLMPVHNGEPYVSQAIDSVLNQSFGDFEFLIIDDGSTDRTPHIVQQYCDKRIRFVRNETNLGLISTLNAGLDLANGKYVARLDCDDICNPERLEKQIDYLVKHPDVSICGTWVKTIGTRESVWRFPEESARIKCLLLLHCPLVHSTVMFRKDVMDRQGLRYSKEFVHAEDYALWVRASKVTEFANVPMCLLDYRIHTHQIGQTHGSEQREATDRIRRMQFQELCISLSGVDLAYIQKLVRGLGFASGSSLHEVEDLITSIVLANRKKRIYSQEILEEELARLWCRCIRSSSIIGLTAFKYYMASPLAIKARDPMARRLSFLVRCLLKRP